MRWAISGQDLFMMKGVLGLGGKGQDILFTGRRVKRCPLFIRRSGARRGRGLAIKY